MHHLFHRSLSQHLQETSGIRWRRRMAWRPYVKLALWVVALLVLGVWFSP